MIDRQQAEQVAQSFARRQTMRLGYECAAEIDEFDLGYVISSTIPVGAQAGPGDLPVSVLDRETGELSSWPRLPPPVVQRLYREDRATRPHTPRTVDPATQLLREIRRAPTPGVAAHLTVEGVTHIGRGAKGDVELRHHPLVRSYLDELPAGQLMRGGERHAELIALSDALHAHDHHRAAVGEHPMTMDDALDLLETAQLEIFRVREPGDPAGGLADRPCDSCLNALVHFNLLPWSDLAFTQEWIAPPETIPEPGRFPPEIAHALVAAGWRPTFGDDVLAAETIEEIAAVPGRVARHPSLSAAEALLTDFPSLVGGRRGPGEDVWIARFDIRPRVVAHTADTLADFAGVLGARLFPIGTELGDSILAVDEHGRIFALDQAGEWFLGADIDIALTNLLLGRAPARVRDDGTW